jgi:prepilin-type N-terminal cleavage/methylation domain-containing protein
VKRLKQADFLKPNRRKSFGFTIVELLVVIVVIAILASLIIVAYRGIQGRAAYSEHKSDQSTIYNAILTARLKTDNTLAEITDNTCTSCGCWDEWPDTEPKDLPKSSTCWQEYYDALDGISDASGVNLDAFRDGDSRGNPSFALDENEGEYSDDPCEPDGLTWWAPSGEEGADWKDIPLSLQECL